jgi:Calcineurin-like phosphoesterase
MTNYKNWTPAELKLLGSTLSNSELSKKMGRSQSAVRTKRFELGLKNPGRQQVNNKLTIEQDLKEKDESHWMHEHSALSKKYHTLLKEQTVVERLVQRIASLAPLSYSPAPAILSGTSRKHEGNPQSAVLMLSDCHIGKTTSPNQTLSFGSYNFDIFMARLKFLEDAVLSISRNHVSTEVPELVIPMLGDMLDGTLTHSNESGQLDPIFTQFYAGGHALAQFLRNLAPHFPLIRVYSVVGNHTRFQGQHRMPTKNRFSNFDQFLYAYIGALVRDIPNIKWTLDAQPFTIFEVQNSSFFGMHGDTLRGGDKALGVPSHAVGRLVSTATQLMNKHGKKAPNYYLTGHLHRSIVLPHATGSIIVNGGFPSTDEYSLAEMFTPSDSSQTFFFVHPKFGKTASYEISLKFAEVSKTPPYIIPSEFEMR